MHFGINCYGIQTRAPAMTWFMCTPLSGQLAVGQDQCPDYECESTRSFTKKVLISFTDFNECQFEFHASLLDKKQKCVKSSMQL